MELKSFHFDLGDSNEGPVGFCAQVRAESKEQALELLREALPEQVEVDCEEPDSGEPGIEYIEIYLNSDNFTEQDIDDVEPVEEEEEDDEPVLA